MSPPAPPSPSLVYKYVKIGKAYLHRGDHNQQILDVGHAVHQIGRDPGQIFVGKLARREDVHHVRGLRAARRRNVHDAGRLLLLQVRDEAGLQVVLLLQHVHPVAAARQRQQHAVLLVHLERGKGKERDCLEVRKVICNIKT